ncbi:keratin-associated protein 19-2-like [Daphnia pulicaria]|uniref:keratin-associated protein 19-2-like n=1 Tax=Daphnia pulicaria TaxID=35523 RepID=UPI001EEAD351|nr:keratin-associated protein 19-2-like [Daphnia pulicaria]
MNNFIAISLFLGVVIALCSAYPSSYGGYGNSYGGFEPAYAPHFGSGYDTYIYGSYFGHPGPYDTYGKSYNNYNGGNNYDKGYHQTPYAYPKSYGSY